MSWYKRIYGSFYNTGKIEEIMLIKNQADLEAFKKMYGIDDEIEKEY